MKSFNWLELLWKILTLGLAELLDWINDQRTASRIIREGSIQLTRRQKKLIKRKSKRKYGYVPDKINQLLNNK